MLLCRIMTRVWTQTWSSWLMLLTLPTPSSKRHQRVQRVPAALQSPLRTQVILSKNPILTLTCEPGRVLLWEVQQQQRALRSLPCDEHVANSVGYSGVKMEGTRKYKD